MIGKYDHPIDRVDVIFDNEYRVRVSVDLNKSSIWTSICDRQGAVLWMDITLLSVYAEEVEPLRWLPEGIVKYVDWVLDKATAREQLALSLRLLLRTDGYSLEFSGGRYDGHCP